MYAALLVITIGVERTAADLEPRPPFSSPQPTPLVLTLLPPR